MQSLQTGDIYIICTVHKVFVIKENPRICYEVSDRKSTLGSQIFGPNQDQFDSSLVQIFVYVCVCGSGSGQDTGDEKDTVG